MTDHLESLLSATTHEGWKALVMGQRARPEQLSLAEFRKLSARDRHRYSDHRSVWHANLGPYLSPSLKDLMRQLTRVVGSNRQDGHRARRSPVLDAHAGLGKTTIAMHFGRVFAREQIEYYGEYTSAGHVRIPVAFISLTSSTTMRSLNRMLCHFYGHPSAAKADAGVLGVRAAACAAAHETKLIIVDDVHFLDVRRQDGREVANHFKWLVNEFATTFFFVGVGLVDRGLFTEGMSPSSAQYAQTARRWTRLTLDPFEIGSADGTATWIRLLKAIEHDLVLINKTPGMLAGELADYLYGRSSGRFGSLMTLITEGSFEAVDSGEERLTAELLDTIRIDEGAEQARPAIEASIRRGTITTRKHRTR